MLSRTDRDVAWRNELADGVFDAREDRFGLFDPRAGRRVDVQAKLAGIDRREEVAADERHECANALPTSDGEEDEHGGAMLQRPGERIDVTADASSRSAFRTPC